MVVFQTFHRVPWGDKEHCNTLNKRVAHNCRVGKKRGDPSSPVLHDVDDPNLAIHARKSGTWHLWAII